MPLVDVTGRPTRTRRLRPMGFLKRLLGGNEPVEPLPEVDPAEAEAAEQAHELDVLRAEQAGFDELTERQLRYAQYAWEPPAQGGDRRAEDGDVSS